MRRQFKRALLLICCVAALFCIYCFGADAYDYGSYSYTQSIPSNWQELEVTVGSVTMPFELYPDGSWFDPDKGYMYRAEQKVYGFDVGADLYLRGWECVGFARYAYAALFYKFPANASIDTSLAYGYGYSYAYSNAIQKVLGTATLSPGYTADTVEKLFKACAPGAVMRIGGHSMVLMAIFDDGVIIYDANFSYDDEVDVRKYTWQGFVNSFGNKEFSALHMPNYYPGYSYSTGGGSDDYQVDTSVKGTYVVTDISTYLNVRNKPYSYAASVGKLYDGDEVYVLGEYKGWAKIDYQGVGRWISMDYLRIKAEEIKVTFDPDGGKASYTSDTYEVGIAFGDLPTATKSGRIFGGWYNGYTKYTKDSKVPIVSSLTLKAKWCVLYADVGESEWYTDYVIRAHDEGLLDDGTYFYPDDNASRAEVVAMLGKVHEAEAGALQSVTQTPFTDVSADSSYAKYVVWGNENGIVKGLSATKFGPDNDVTREQIAVFLYRHANYCGIGYEVGSSMLGDFADGSKVSDWAKDAMSWAVDAGIFQGNSDNTLNPAGNTKRREMVTVFCRYLDYMASHEPTVEPEPDLEPETVTVTFDANGGNVDASSKEYEVGAALGELPTPTKSKRNFAGWYNGSTQYTSDSTAPAEGITLTAKWRMMEYTDLYETDWMAPHVEACYDYGMLTGSGQYRPNDNATRSDVVIMLGRGYQKQSGETIPAATECVFTDVDPESTAYKYVVWAYDTGLTTGVSATEFAPKNAVTREQLVLFLFRMACNSGVTSAGERDTSNVDAFSDASDVDEVYRTAMSWAISEGIIQGDTNGLLNPNKSATRAELATVIRRYLDIA